MATNPFSTTANAFNPTTVGKVAGQEQGLASWAAPYVTGMLGKTQALTEEPYQTYQGPLTAGPSSLQQQYFQGLGQIGFPSILGKSFSSAGAPTLPTFSGQQPGGRVEDYNRMMAGIPGMPTMPTSGGPLGGFGSGGPQLTSDALTPEGRQMMESGRAAVSPVNTFPGPSAEDYFGARSQGMPAAQGIASQYMNPYLSSVLAPQLSELQRQAQIAQMNQASKLSQAGAYGGGRQAIMEAELNRNLLEQLSKTTGAGYATAYDKAMQQFNTEQQQAMGLAGMLSGAGAQQRAIEAEGIAADKAEFERQRQDPYERLKFQQAMLQNMPITAMNVAYQEESPFSKLMTGAGGLMDIYKDLFPG